MSRQERPVKLAIWLAWHLTHVVRIKCADNAISDRIDKGLVEIR